MVSYSPGVDPVFKALADPTRRELLDELFREDGQPLNALTRRFSMTRIGVAKHLQILEDAGLVVSKRQGREKLHYLNPVPIRLVHDRWVDKYTKAGPRVWPTSKQIWSAPWRRSSRSTSGPHQSGCGKRSPPRDPLEVPLRSRIESDFTPGSRFEMVHPGGDDPLAEGENIEVDPPRRLVQTMRALWGPDVIAEGTSRLTWEIEPVGDSCRLILTHDQLRDGANEQLFGGWPMILSGLKTWLETGELLTTRIADVRERPRPGLNYRTRAATTARRTTRPSRRRT